MKKGSKIFGLIIKLFGSNDAKAMIKKQVLEATDTNNDGEITLEDFANGKWKDISWWKVAVAVSVLIGTFYFGIETLETWVEFLSK